MGKYDRIMKLLVDGNPRAIVQFVLQRLQLTRGLIIKVDGIEVLGQLSTEFQGTEADADGLLLVTTEDGRQFLVHIEFQRKRDPLMGDRLLDYCLRARRKHSPKNGPPLPILSCVIFLIDDGQVPEPPLTWELFDGQKNLVFDYVCIKLWETPREELLALNQPGLLPLSLLTKGEVNRIIVKEMFDELLANKLNDLLPVGQTIATWVLGATDLAWLKREYHKMLDFFKDSPAYEWMTEDARKEGREEGREEIRTQLQRALDVFRQTVVGLVAERSPKLVRLAKKQVAAVENPEKLQKAVLLISSAKEDNEVARLLADLDESED